MTYQINTRYFMDSHVVLFQRSDGSENWQYRLRIPGIKNRYLRRTAQTSDFEKAKNLAIKEWQRMCFKQEEGLAVFSKTFGDVAKEIAEKEEDRVNRGDVSAGHWSYRRIVIFKYLIPFFGSLQINAVNQTKMEAYWPWRLDYWKRPENINPSKAGRKSEKPAFKTIVHDVQMLAQIFSYAEDRNWCDKKDIPKIVNPLKPADLARAYFTEKEWKQVYAYMRKWAHEPSTQWQKLTRDRLRYRATLSYHTGMRTIESSNFRWKDIDDFVDQDGTRYAQLWVHGKKKSRGIIAPVRVLHLLNAWKQKAKYIDDNDHVFSITSGNRPTHDDVLFRKVLSALELTDDRYNRPRTLGSLRHTYAMNQLVKLRTDIALLAKNMGTSVDVIQNYYGKHFASSMRASELVRQDPRKSVDHKLDQVLDGLNKEKAETITDIVRRDVLQQWIKQHGKKPDPETEEPEIVEGYVYMKMKELGQLDLYEPRLDLPDSLPD